MSSNVTLGFGPNVEYFPITLKPVVSYTTRDKRVNETDGVEHYFITPEVAAEKLKTEHILAYTKIGEIEYFATLEAINDSNLYIIDPKGIAYLKENFPNLNTKVIYIKTDDNLRMKRAAARDNEDFMKSFKSRCEDEDEQFTDFEKAEQYDLLLLNNNDGSDCITAFREFVIKSEKEYLTSGKDKPLYLVVGRTGSGKDYICTETSKSF